MAAGAERASPATETGGIEMSEAPERIWAWAWEIDTSRGQWALNPSVGFDGEAEYIRADLVEAAVKRALEGAASFLDEMALQNGYTKTPRGRTAIHYARKVRALDPAQFIDGQK